MFQLHKKQIKKVSIDSIPSERRSPILPWRDWKILVISLSVLFIAISAWHGYLLWLIGNDELIGTAVVVPETTEKLNKVEVNALGAVINTRASTTEILRARGLPFVDPSL